MMECLHRLKINAFVFICQIFVASGMANRNEVANRLREISIEEEERYAVLRGKWQEGAAKIRAKLKESGG